MSEECAVGRTAQRHRPPCPKPVVRIVHLPPVGGTTFAEIPLCAEHDSEFEAYAESKGLRVGPTCAAGRYLTARDDERFASWGTPCNAVGTEVLMIVLDDGSGFHEMTFCQLHFADLEAHELLLSEYPTPGATPASPEL